MYRISLLLLAFCLLSSLLQGQPPTEVYLIDIQHENGVWTISRPANISNNEGYDNQPFFSPHDKALLYTSAIPPDGQTDLKRYDLETGETTRLTTSNGSEYSPTVTPDGQFISTIILEKSGRQLLWKYPINGGEPEVVVPDLKIGYHTWVTNDVLVVFVLGEPNTMQICNLTLGGCATVEESIGRSLHWVEGIQKVSFIHKGSGEPWVIKTLDPNSLLTGTIGETLEGAEDMVWWDDLNIMMASGSKLYRRSILTTDQWNLVKDFSSEGLHNITRLAISPTGRKMALVAEP